MARLFAAAMALMLGGCLPDLSAWQVVQAGVDAGPLPGTDGGTGQPNPIELGTPCPNPHLLLGTVAVSSDAARILRIDPSTDAPCRASELVTEQRAFGAAVRDVDWHPETGELAGLDDAVLGLDDEGFPRWRYQSFGYSGFGGDWVVAFGSGASLRIAIAWVESSSSIDHMLLLDGQGHRTSGDIEPPFFAAMVAAHPDGSGRLLMPSRANADLTVYSVNDSTTTISDTSGTPLWGGGAVDLPSTYGYRQHIASDVATQRLVITHANGVAFWRVGASPPSTAYACPSYCSSFRAAAPDPSADDGAYAICSASGGSTQHLVHLRGSSCTLVIDGTSLGGRMLTDVALARAAL